MFFDSVFQTLIVRLHVHLFSHVLYVCEEFCILLVHYWLSELCLQFICKWWTSTHLRKLHFWKRIFYIFKRYKSPYNNVLELFLSNNTNSDCFVQHLQQMQNITHSWLELCLNCCTDFTFMWMYHNLSHFSQTHSLPFKSKLNPGPKAFHWSVVNMTVGFNTADILSQDAEIPLLTHISYRTTSERKRKVH